uniref:Uncharacterized protein n=1 Tax=Fagus sylvatica TaxID=28930 RepID=A0A2N9I7Z1_FAGSY
METTSSTVLESPIFAERTAGDAEPPEPRWWICGSSFRSHQSGMEAIQRCLILSSAGMVVATSTAVATSSSSAVPIVENAAPRYFFNSVFFAALVYM